LPSRFSITESVYTGMLSYLDAITHTEQSGRKEDVSFMMDPFWLQDTAVIENIEKWKGEWSVSLVFAYHKMPMKFLKRHIVSYSSRQKADVAAHYMRRQAAKDQRGTLQVDKALFTTNNN
jgi:hypothetical protein